MSQPRLGVTVAFAALVAFACLPAAAQTTIAPPADIAARKELNIALFASFPPMAYKTIDTNELVGVDVDLASYLGQKFGVTIGQFGEHRHQRGFIHILQ